MANKAKVATEVETLNEEVATEVETLNEEVATEVETLNEEVATEVETLADTDILESDDEKNHREEIQSLDSGYTVIANLKHNGNRYNVGDKISLSEDEALALIGTVE